MNEIKKYVVTGFSFNPITNLLNTTYAEVTDATQPVCMWSDIEPIVQRNKELEAELARLLKSFEDSKRSQAMLIRAGWKINADLDIRVTELEAEIARLQAPNRQVFMLAELG